MNSRTTTWLGCLMMFAIFSSGCASFSGVRGSVEFGRVQVLSQVDTLPQPAHPPEVRFPEVQLAQGMEGTAEIEFVVDENGVPGSFQVRAETDPAFGAAAIAGMRRVRYVPARRDGRRVPCRLGQTIFFRVH